MQLRSHPLMTFRGRPNWPPQWIWISGGDNKHPTGEIGVLQEIRTSSIDQPVCFLTIQYNESNYLGTLIFTHPKFYEEVCELLKRNAGRPLNEIGAMGY
jgi:hypothetical protein